MRPAHPSHRTAILVTLIGALLAGCGSTADTNQALTGNAPIAPATATRAPATTAVAPPPSTGPEPTLKRGIDGCDHRIPKRPTVLRTYATAPPLILAGGAEAYTIVLDTSCGRLTIAPDKQGGSATDALSALAQRRFYDGLSFFRVVPGYLVQTGDPKNDGAGGPGFTVQGTAPPKDTVYAVGDVAMAKTRQQPDGTAGSQFFIVTGEAGTKSVSPMYAIVGHVIGASSLATLRRLDAFGVGDGPPLKPLFILRARVVVG